MDFDTKKMSKEKPGLPPANLRPLEGVLNDVFKQYMQLYYDKGTSSVYVWETKKPVTERERTRGMGTTEMSTAIAILIKKEVIDPRIGCEACWDSIHVIEISDSSSSHVTYRLNASVIVKIRLGDEKTGTSEFNYSTQKFHEQKVSVQRVYATHERSNPLRHVTTVGAMVENMENTIRQSMENVTAPRLLQNVSSVRSKADEDTKIYFQMEMEKLLRGEIPSTITMEKTTYIN